MARGIPLTQGHVALVDAVDYDWLMQWKWCVQRQGKRWYAVTSIGGRNHRQRIQMHRLVMDAPDGLDVDHIDNNGLNNTRANLRLATRQQNMFNKPLTEANNSGYKGVYWHKHKMAWGASIQRDGKQISLGYFDSPEDAALAYDRAAIELFGEYAYLNLPGSDAEPKARELRLRGRRPAKLTDDQVVEIRALAASGVLHREIANRFGVTPQYVSQLKRGLWRKNVTVDAEVRP